jgi:hypothetical protein
MRVGRSDKRLGEIVNNGESDFGLRREKEERGRL